MGACPFMECTDAVTAREGFNALCKQEIFWNDHNDYNSTISTCSMGRCRHTFPKFSAKNEKTAIDMVQNVFHNGEKWIADYIDLGVVGYRVTSVEKKSQKHTTAKWKMQYVPCPIFEEDANCCAHKPLKGYDTKKEAENAAKKAILQNDSIKGFDIYKKPVLVSGEEVVSILLRTEKDVKTKPKSAKMGTRVVPIHRYVFFGFASI